MPCLGTKSGFSLIPLSLYELSPVAWRMYWYRLEVVPFGKWASANAEQSPEALSERHSEENSGWWQNVPNPSLLRNREFPAHLMVILARAFPSSFITNGPIFISLLIKHVLLFVLQNSIPKNWWKWLLRFFFLGIKWQLFTHFTWQPLCTMLCTLHMAKTHCSRSVSKIDLRSQRKFQWNIKFWGKATKKHKIHKCR